MITTRPHLFRARHRGFTITEILIAVAIIVVLLSALATALVGVNRYGQSAKTRYLMTNINQALVRFESEVGYTPPVLDLGRNVIAPPTLPVGASGVTPAQFAVNLQNWFSYTSLAEYLIGPGDRSVDGYGFVGGPGASPPASPAPGGEQEFPRLGIRHPGDDGCWGAWIDPLPGSPGLGLLGSRNLRTGAAASNTTTTRYQQGKPYGPFLELKDDRLLGGVRLDSNGQPQFDANGEPIIVFAGEVTNFEALPKVIVDTWGRPIRYYRALYPNPLLKTAYKPLPANLGDVIALRPYRFSAGVDTDTSTTYGTSIFADSNNDTSTSRLLQAARVALLSSGPDRRLNPGVRADNEEFNADNIVEIGP